MQSAIILHSYPNAIRACQANPELFVDIDLSDVITGSEENGLDFMIIYNGLPKTFSSYDVATMKVPRITRVCKNMRISIECLNTDTKNVYKRIFDETNQYRFVEYNYGEGTKEQLEDFCREEGINEVIPDAEEEGIRDSVWEWLNPIEEPLIVTPARSYVNVSPYVSSQHQPIRQHAVNPACSRRLF